jgi:hypothetical protein
VRGAPGGGAAAVVKGVQQPPGEAVGADDGEAPVAVLAGEGRGLGVADVERPRGVPGGVRAREALIRRGAVGFQAGWPQSWRWTVKRCWAKS